MSAPVIVRGEIAEGAVQTARPLLFFTFHQNNSGGSFDFDALRGISQQVIIQALDYNDANERAERLGLYFDGINAGLDCRCCGDRWYRLSSYDEGTSEPTIYGEPASEYVGWGWMGEKPETFVHHYDNRIEAVYAANQEQPAGELVG